MMKSKNKIPIKIIILVSLFSIMCSDNDSDRFSCDSAICTEEFRSIILTIKHSSKNTPYVLTDYKVLRVLDNKEITIPQDSYETSNGYYPVANDSQKEMFRFKHVELVFKGYLNNDLVVQRRFTVTADCCHISLLEGETSINL